MMPPALVEAFMSNPEIMQIIQKPGMMEKFQRLMTNPESLYQSSMNDPDLMKLLKFANEIGGGSSSSIFDQNTTTSSAFNSASSNSPVLIEEIHSQHEFDKLLQSGKDSQNRLIIIDFYADQCKPCQHIKPIFDEQARVQTSKHPELIKFAKVNADKCSDNLVLNCGVSSFPTIKFYYNNKQIDEMKGFSASFEVTFQSKIQSLMQQNFAGLLLKEEANLQKQYISFPAKRNEMVFFKNVKQKPLADDIRKLATEEKTNKFEEEKLQTLDSLLDLLQNTSQQHSSGRLTKSHWKLICENLMKLPFQNQLPILNMVRILVLHPDMSCLLYQTISDGKKVENIKKNENEILFLKTEDFEQENLVLSISEFTSLKESFLQTLFNSIEIGLNEDSKFNLQVGLVSQKIFLNMFNRNSMSMVVIEQYEKLFGLMSQTLLKFLNHETPQTIKVTIKNLMLAVSSLFLNFSIKMKQNIRDEISSQHSFDFDSIKILAVSTLNEIFLTIISKMSNNTIYSSRDEYVDDVLYRLLVSFATFLQDDQMCIDIVNSLDSIDVLKQFYLLYKNNSSQSSIKHLFEQCLTEVLDYLESDKSDNVD